MDKNDVKYILFGNSLNMLISLENFIRLLITLTVFLSIIPLPLSFRARMLRILYVSLVCLLVLHIYRVYGKPQFNRNVGECEWDCYDCSIGHLCCEMLSCATCFLWCCSLPHHSNLSLCLWYVRIILVYVKVVIHELVPLCKFVYALLFATYPETAK